MKQVVMRNPERRTRRERPWQNWRQMKGDVERLGETEEDAREETDGGALLVRHIPLKTEHNSGIVGFDSKHLLRNVAMGLRVSSK
jgi:hypothetical protein